MPIEGTLGLSGRPPMTLLIESGETANPLKPIAPIDDTPPPAAADSRPGQPRPQS